MDPIAKNHRVAGPCLLALTVAVAGTVAAGDLIRYRHADGSVGFADGLGGVPAGAVVLTHEKLGTARDTATDAAPPTIGELVPAVRQRCQAHRRLGPEAHKHCITGQTRAAFAYHDLRSEFPPGSAGRDLVAGCSDGRDAAPDFHQILACAESALDAYVSRQGGDTSSLDRPAPRPARRSEQTRRSQRDRLERLREDQERVDRENAIGRNVWGPRYRKAQRALDDAESKTERIIERMRQRGCRTDSLACGGLSNKLTAARRVEAEKRDYLTSGLVDECRRAGCQPGWLR